MTLIKKKKSIIFVSLSGKIKLGMISLSVLLLSPLSSHVKSYSELVSLQPLFICEGFGSDLKELLPQTKLLLRQ